MSTSFKRRFFVRDVDERVYTLSDYLKKEHMYNRYATVRRRLLREYCKSYFRDVVIPHDSVYLEMIRLSAVPKKNQIMPTSKQSLLYVMLDPESFKPVLYYGRWSINSDEICRINLDKMSYSDDDGNTWHKIPQVTRSGENREGRKPLVDIPGRGHGSDCDPADRGTY